MPVPELPYHNFIVPPGYGVKFQCRIVSNRYQNFVHAIYNGTQVIVCDSGGRQSQDFDTGIENTERVINVQAGWKEVPDGNHRFIGSRPMEEIRPNNFFIRFSHGSESNAILLATLNIQYYK